MSSVLKPDQQPAFVANYNRSTFVFDHSLHDLTNFETADLLAMAQRLPDPAYYSTADSSIADGWKRIGDRRLSLAETLEALPSTNSLVLLKHCEKDPEFGAAFRALMDEVVAHAGEALRADLDKGRATVIVSSPGRVTSYHIDAEVNFLLQVRGRKLLYTFDPNDRTIVSEAELEAFYDGDMDAVRYRQERQAEARAFALEPGLGVHLPLHTPHWAQNLDGVSVGVSLNFNLRSGARLGKVYKVNHRLRRAGMQPAAPGASPWRDRVKIAALAGASQMRSLVRPRAAKAAFD